MPQGMCYPKAAPTRCFRPDAANTIAMCGRSAGYTWREIVALYRLTQPAINLQPRYNIAPTTIIDVVKGNSYAALRSLHRYIGTSARCMLTGSVIASRHPRHSKI